MREFSKQDKPLYRWKLMDNKQLVKHKITSWDLVPWGSGYTASMRYEFRIGSQMAVSYLKSDEVDMLLYNRYYSFEDNDEKVRQIFCDYFIRKVNKAQSELDRYIGDLEEFKKYNP